MSYKSSGHVLTLTAPAAGVTAGVPTFIGTLFVVPRITAASGVSFDADVAGIHALPKTASQAWAEGQKIYWDVANARCDSGQLNGPLIGTASQAIGSGAGETTGYVRLSSLPQVGEIVHLRARVTIANVN